MPERNRRRPILRDLIDGPDTPPLEALFSTNTDPNAYDDVAVARREVAHPVSRGLAAGFAGMTAGGYDNQALGAELAGEPERANALRAQSALYARSASEETLPEMDYRNVNGVGDALRFIGGHVGSAAATMTPALAAGLITRGRGGLRAPMAYAGALAPSYILERNEAISNQYADPELAAMDPQRRLEIARAKGLAGGALEAIVPGTLAGGMGRAGLSPLRTIAGASGQEAVTEAGQGAVGILAEETLRRGSLDQALPELANPERRPELINAALAGAAGGGGIALPTAATQGVANLAVAAGDRAEEAARATVSGAETVVDKAAETRSRVRQWADGALAEPPDVSDLSDEELVGAFNEWATEGKVVDDDPAEVARANSTDIEELLAADAESEATAPARAARAAERLINDEAAPLELRAAAERILRGEAPPAELVQLLGAAKGYQAGRMARRAAARGVQAVDEATEFMREAWGKAEEGGGIPLMITTKMREGLKAAGVTDEQIRKMSPRAAWERLSGKGPTKSNRQELSDQSTLSVHLFGQLKPEYHADPSLERNLTSKLGGLARTLRRLESAAAEPTRELYTALQRLGPALDMFQDPAQVLGPALQPLYEAANRAQTSAMDDSSILTALMPPAFRQAAPATRAKLGALIDRAAIGYELTEQENGLLRRALGGAQTANDTIRMYRQMTPVLKSLQPKTGDTRMDNSTPEEDAETGESYDDFDATQQGMGEKALAQTQTQYHFAPGDAPFLRVPDEDGLTPARRTKLQMESADGSRRVRPINLRQYAREMGENPADVAEGLRASYQERREKGNTTDAEDIIFEQYELDDDGLLRAHQVLRSDQTDNPYDSVFNDTADLHEKARILVSTKNATKAQIADRKSTHFKVYRKVVNARNQTSVRPTTYSAESLWKYYGDKLSARQREGIDPIEDGKPQGERAKDLFARALAELALDPAVQKIEIAPGTVIDRATGTVVPEDANSTVPTLDKAARAKRDQRAADKKAEKDSVKAKAAQIVKDSGFEASWRARLSEPGVDPRRALVAIQEYVDRDVPKDLSWLEKNVQYEKNRIARELAEDHVDKILPYPDQEAHAEGLGETDEMFRLAAGEDARRVGEYVEELTMLVGDLGMFKIKLGVANSALADKEMHLLALDFGSPTPVPSNPQVVRKGQVAGKDPLPQPAAVDPQVVTKAKIEAMEIELKRALYQELLDAGIAREHMTAALNKKRTLNPRQALLTREMEERVDARDAARTEAIREAIAPAVKAGASEAMLKRAITAANKRLHAADERARRAAQTRGTKAVSARDLARQKDAIIKQKRRDRVRGRIDDVDALPMGEAQRDAMTKRLAGPRTPAERYAEKQRLAKEKANAKPVKKIPKRLASETPSLTLKEATDHRARIEAELAKLSTEPSTPARNARQRELNLDIALLDAGKAPKRILGLRNKQHELGNVQAEDKPDRDWFRKTLDELGQDSGDFGFTKLAEIAGPELWTKVRARMTAGSLVMIDDLVGTVATDESIRKMLSDFDRAEGEAYAPAPIDPDERAVYVEIASMMPADPAAEAQLAKLLGTKGGVEKISKTISMMRSRPGLSRLMALLAANHDTPAGNRLLQETTDRMDDLIDEVNTYSKRNARRAGRFAHSQEATLAYDDLRFRMDGRPLTEMLAEAAKLDSPYAELFRVLSRAKVLGPIKMVSQLHNTSFFNPAKQVVTMGAPSPYSQSGLQDLAHESTHALTLLGEVSDAQLRADLGSLLDHVRGYALDTLQLDITQHYGMSDTQEFLAEAFSNPEFQAILRRVPALQTKTYKNAWQEFIGLIQRLFGDSISKTALDEALTLGFAAAKAGRNSRGGTGVGMYGNRGSPLYEDNGSGESSASLEAIGRQRDEDAQGRTRLLIDRDGSTRELRGVDAVDTHARDGQIIVQRGIGAKEWTVLSHGNDLTPTTLIGRANRAGVKLSTLERKKSGIGISRETKREISEEMKRIAGWDTKAKIRKHLFFVKAADIEGASGQYSPAERIIKIAFSAVDPLGVAYHEALHDFVAGMESHGKEARQLRNQLMRAAEMPHIRAQLKELLKDHPNALKQIESDPEERLAYVFQFWAMGRHIGKPIIKINDKNTENAFYKLARWIYELLGVVSQSDKMEAVLDALYEGKFADRNVVAEVIHDMKLDTLQDKFRRISGPLADYADKLMLVATDRLRSYGVTEMDWVADKMMTEPGREEGGLRFIQRRSRMAAKFDNLKADLFKDSTAVERATALRNLQSMKAPSTPLEKEIVALLDQVYDYMVEAGVQRLNPDTKQWEPLKKENLYFPRVWDAKAILNNEAEFKQLLFKHGNVGFEQQGAIVKAISQGDGQIELADSEYHVGFTPFASAVQDRKLKFINPSNAADFAKFQSRDIGEVLTRHIFQAVHRAEFARDFGNAGEAIEAKFDAVVDKLTEAEILGARNAIKGLIGTLGADLSPARKDLYSAAITAQNVILLPLAIFSQFIDALGVGLRSQDPTEAWSAFKRGMGDFTKAVRKHSIDQPDYDTEMAKTIGLIDEQNMLEAMGQAHAGAFMSGFGRKINRKFFRWNGMEGWNRSMRVSAMVAGERFIQREIGNSRYMNELGLEKSDVMVKPDGRLAVTYEQLRQLGATDAQAKAREKKIQEALFRFVDGAVLRPQAANRPPWMSDPHWMLVAHLKQFAFAFQKTILARVNNEFENGKVMPAAILAAYVPVMMASGLARATLTGKPIGDGGFWDLMNYGVLRSGILGTGSFGTDVFGDLERGDLPGSSLIGPTAEHVWMSSRFLVGDPEVDVGKVMDRSLPFARYF